MPYIQIGDRVRFDNLLDRMMLADIRSAGELNYLITHLVHIFLDENPNYQKFNDALGALEGAKLELYRKFVAPYEDIKARTNGEVP